MLIQYPFSLSYEHSPHPVQCINVPNQREENFPATATPRVVMWHSFDQWDLSKCYEELLGKLCQRKLVQRALDFCPFCCPFSCLEHRLEAGEGAAVLGTWVAKKKDWRNLGLWGHCLATSSTIDTLPLDSLLPEKKKTPNLLQFLVSQIWGDTQHNTILTDTPCSGWKLGNATWSHGD